MNVEDQMLDDLHVASEEAAANVYSPSYPFERERRAFEHGWRVGFLAAKEGQA